MTSKTRVGIDTGGTFTDFIVFRDGALTVHKVLSTPDAPERAILQGLNELNLLGRADVSLFIVHGSTVATNAVLEGKGVRTAYITNTGLTDVLSIGRQTRRELYNLQPAVTPPPVPAELCLACPTRIAANGEIIQTLTQEALQQLRQQLIDLAPRAVAINLLFSYVDDQHECAIEAIVPESVFVSRSSAVLPVYKEYERGMATWLNAYIGPLMQGYLQRLQHALPKTPLAIMQSSGGTIAAEQAGQRAVHLLLSGPAGGLAATRYMMNDRMLDRVLTFDMGGTSTDVAMIDGDLQLTTEGYIGEYPVAVPMVDLHTIGAGGGSIAYVDAGGMLQVGPQSAGAMPGPACYGHHGQQPTVTDANLILGRLLPEAFLGGRMQLDVKAAHHAMTLLADELNLDVMTAAAGVIRIVNENMAQALRVMSVQRGIDPRELTLMSFGGAGGLHVCALAEALDMTQAMVPAYAGVLSALGMIVAPRTRQLSQTVGGLLQDYLDNQIEQLFAPLIQQGRSELIQEGVAEEHIEYRCSLDLRYEGQSYTLNVVWYMYTDWAQRSFEELHRQRYGHQLDLPVELVNVCVALSASSEPVNLPRCTQATPAVAYQTATLYGIAESVPVYARDQIDNAQCIQGPALITEDVSTTFVAPGWNVRKDPLGNLLLRTMSAKDDATTQVLTVYE